MARRVDTNTRIDTNIKSDLSVPRVDLSKVTMPKVDLSKSNIDLSRISTTKMDLDAGLARFRLNMPNYIREANLARTDIETKPIYVKMKAEFEPLIKSAGFKTADDFLDTRLKINDGLIKIDSLTPNQIKVYNTWNETYNPLTRQSALEGQSNTELSRLRAKITIGDLGATYTPHISEGQVHRRKQREANMQNGVIDQGYDGISDFFKRRTGQVLYPDASKSFDDVYFYHFRDSTNRNSTTEQIAHNWAEYYRSKGMNELADDMPKLLKIAEPKAKRIDEMQDMIMALEIRNKKPEVMESISRLVKKDSQEWKQLYREIDALMAKMKKDVDFAKEFKVAADTAGINRVNADYKMRANKRTATDGERSRALEFAHEGEVKNFLEHGGVEDMERAPAVADTDVEELYAAGLVREDVTAQEIVDFIEPKLYGDGISSMGNRMLTKQDRGYYSQSTARKLLGVIAQSSGDRERRHAIEREMLYFRTNTAKKMMENVGMAYNIPGGGKAIFNDMYNRAFKTAAPVKGWGDKIADALMTLRYSNTLGGISRGAVQNVLEPGIVMGINGMKLRDTIPSYADAKRLVAAYGKGVGLTDAARKEAMGSTFQSEYTTEYTTIKKTGKMLKNLVKSTTLVFDKTQMISTISFMNAAEKMGIRQGLSGADLTYFVSRQVSRWHIGADGLGRIAIASSPLGRMATMFWTWPIKDYKRSAALVRQANEVGGTPAAMKAAIGIVGSKALTFGVLNAIGGTLTQSMGLNPFGLFDHYSELDEEDRILFDNIVDILKLNVITSIIADVYYGFRSEAEAAEDAERDFDPVRAIFGDTTNAFESPLLKNVIPAGGFLNRTMQSANLYSTGASYSGSGAKQYEANTFADDQNVVDNISTVMDMMAAFIAGKSSTYAGMEYRGMWNPTQRVTRGDISGALSSWTDMQNEGGPLSLAVGLADLAGIVDGSLLSAQIDAIDKKNKLKEAGLYEDADKVFIPFKQLGADFDGSYNDIAKFSSQVDKAKKMRDDIYPTIAGFYNIYNPYSSEEERTNAKAKIDQAMRPVTSLLSTVSAAYQAAGNEITEFNYSQMRSALDVDTADEGLNDSNENKRAYVEAGLPEITSPTDIGASDYVSTRAQARQAEFYGAPEDMRREIEIMSRGNDEIGSLSSIRSQYNDKISVAMDNKDYDEADRLAWDYMQNQFLPRFDSVIRKYGADIVTRSREVRDALDALAIIPSSYQTVLDKSGRYVSTANSIGLSKTAGFADSFIRNLYGQGTGSYQSSVSSQATTDAISQIRQAQASGRGEVARSIARDALERINDGEIGATPQDFQFIVQIGS